MKLSEIKREWNGASLEDKVKICEAFGVTPHEWGSGRFSPRHPISGRPSRETFMSEEDAAVEQLNWLMSMVD